MIEKCVKWQKSLVLGDATNLYIILLTNGKTYAYNKKRGWEKWTSEEWASIPEEWSRTIESDHWKSYTPLEVIVVCGTKGLRDD